MATTISGFLLRFLWRPAKAPPTTLLGAFASVSSGLLLVALGAVALLQANVAAQWWPQGEPAPASIADDDQYFADALGFLATVGLCVVLAVGCARRKEVLCACLWTGVLLGRPLIVAAVAGFWAGLYTMRIDVVVLLLTQALTFGRGVVGRSLLNGLAPVAVAALARDPAMPERWLGTAPPADIFAGEPFAVSAFLWGLQLIWRGWVGAALTYWRRQPGALSSASSWGNPR
jgi:hypothetical protein